MKEDHRSEELELSEMRSRERLLTKLEASRLAESASRYIFDHEESLATSECFPFIAARVWLEEHWRIRAYAREFAFDMTSSDLSENTKHYWKILSRAMLDVRRGDLNMRDRARDHSRHRDTYVIQQNMMLERELLQVIEQSKVLREMLDLHNTERALLASELSIKETRRGLEQQHAISRIAQLAFIFLPLTFITDIFGMNIKPFGGDAPMWKFWVTTCCVLLPSWFFGLWTARSDMKRN